MHAEVKQWTCWQKKKQWTYTHMMWMTRSNSWYQIWCQFWNNWNLTYFIKTKYQTRDYTYLHILVLYLFFFFLILVKKLELSILKTILPPIFLDFVLFAHLALRIKLLHIFSKNLSFCFTKKKKNPFSNYSYLQIFTVTIFPSTQTKFLVVSWKWKHK